jgi:uncharacterized protein
MTGEIVHFHPWEEVQGGAERAFALHRTVILSLVPAVDVQHVGGTSTPGVRTKGDLDIQVRVPPERFAEADRALATRYTRHPLNERTPAFSSFEDLSGIVPVGVQLSAIGGPTDFFVQAREALRLSSEAAARYDRLKASFEGRSMDEYRKAKELFFNELLQLTPSVAEKSS